MFCHDLFILHDEIYARKNGVNITEKLYQFDTSVIDISKEESTSNDLYNKL